MVARRPLRPRRHIHSSMEVDRARLQRALSQRIYLVGSARVDDALHFHVMGASNTVYRVHVTRDSVACTCPDHTQRGAACKHIIFVLVRVYRVSPEVAGYCLAAMLERAAHSAPACVTTQWHTPNYAAEDECPICLEELADAAGVVWCRYGCGKCFHPDCARRWHAINPTCVLCRAPWGGLGDTQ
jgi:hypothetical protein